MPRRNDIESIMILGAGPIVIGQACEFDYSGTQACRALKEDGYRIILVNSNPATIMTDPEMADATYIEPIHWQYVARIIEQERPDALLPTMGGQTGLNCALDLIEHGILARYDTELIGASQTAIEKAENREQFRQAMDKIGLASARSKVANSLEEAHAIQHEFGFPVILRPSFTLGGTGGGIAYNRREFSQICQQGLEASPIKQILIEESLLGWKEFEMEVVRDKADNCIIVCAIENLDPMGVHTGDSITVAPAQTLTDKEYQIMRDASLAVLREIGVDTGGSNVQFAINPDDGRMVIIEMNPRVSRSSALASKATGFPIAKIAAQLAVGYTLDELSNALTGGETPASFEPTIDYVVTKIPRFAFEKFPSANPVLTTQMKSVGEAMAIGRTFSESIQKALRSLEIGASGFDEYCTTLDQISNLLSTPSAERIFYVADAFRLGLSLEEIHRLTTIDLWFLRPIGQLVELENKIRHRAPESFAAEDWRYLKQHGFSDMRLAKLLGVSEGVVRSHRRKHGVEAAFKHVDTCAAEFATPTAYLYSTYETTCEATRSTAKKIMILGGGPNRIGQGIEFDYCCVHAAMALREQGYETIMVNCNPETVSTDFDISDKLYFEPLTLEDVLEIVRIEQPEGAIVHYGGQTPLKLAQELAAAGLKIIGTSPEAIDEAEDRDRFKQLITRSGLTQPANATATNVDQALKLADAIGYPLVVRPSYVLGGRAMEIVHSDSELIYYMQHAVAVSNQSPILLDRFLSDAKEVDVDAVCDGTNVLIGGIMEHIEQAGVHSGDSACSLPPYSLSAQNIAVIREQTTTLAHALNVVGLMNVQFAIKDDQVFVLEVNPRASRTVPFISKAFGVPLAKIGARVMIGQSLAEIGVTEMPPAQHFAVKEAAFPFNKFPDVDTLLGPEMKSTGEVMGIGTTFDLAFAKSQWAINQPLPQQGCAFLSVRESDKPELPAIAQRLLTAGFSLIATRGTAEYLQTHGIVAEKINKVVEGRPHIVDKIENGEIDLIINTTAASAAIIADSRSIRTSAVSHRIAIFTTIWGAEVAARSISCNDLLHVNALQNLYGLETINT